MIDALPAALWRASWQGALAVLVVWGVCRAGERRLSPALQCALWRLTYAKLLLGLAVAGGVALPLLRPAPPMSAGAPTPAPPTLATFVAPRAEPAPPAALPAAKTASPLPLPALVTVEPAPLRWRSLLAAAYGIGLLVCLTRLFRALWRTRSLLRAASPVNAEESGDADADDAAKVALLRALAASMGLRRTPRLASSASLTSPAYVAGTILLPARADYAPDALRLILAHELAHARRHDLAWEWLGAAAQTLFFFHPLVLLARREERLARESAADALALSVTGATAAGLGNLLLDLAQRPHPRHAPPLAAAIGVVEGGSLLQRRLRALKQTSPTPLRRTIALIAVVALLTLVPWRLIRASKHHVAPNTDIILHSAKFPDIPHGTHRLAGQVRDDAGKPAQDVLLNITLLPAKLPYTPGPVMQPMRVIHADATGRYVFADLPEGHYGIMVTDARASIRLPAAPMHRRSAVGRFAPTLYEMTMGKGANTHTLDLTATSGVTLTGRVLNQATGLPMPGIRVLGSREMARADWMNWMKASSDLSITDARGSYFLRLLPGQVSARLEGTGTQWDYTIDKTFTLSLGQTATHDFHLAPSGYSLPSTLRGDKSIGGVVRSGETGKPMANLAITVATEANGVDGKPFAAFSTRSDAGGNFSVTQIPAGRYKVSLNSFTTATVELGFRDTTKKVTLSYIRPATVSGKITNKATGKPEGNIAIMGACGDTSNIQISQTLLLGADGRYKMELKAGDVFISPYSGVVLYDSRRNRVYVSDYRKGKRLHLAPGQTATLDFAVDESKGIDKRGGT